MRILRFTAEWCQPCKQLAKVIESANLDIPIEVIDIDEKNDIAVEFGIRSIPTLILMDGNIEVKRNLGVLSLNELISWAKV